MKLIQRVIYTGFAAVALVSAAMPAFPAHTPASRASVLQGPDFSWYADVGRHHVPAVVVLTPEAREGWIWSPQRWDWNGRQHVWVEGRWVRDDFAEQVAIHNLGVPATLVAEVAPAHAVIIERR